MDPLPVNVETPLLISGIVPVIDGGYNLVAVTTLLLWDILITLPREAKYIWSYPSRYNWITLLYIITRYVPFITSAASLISLSIPVPTQLSVLFNTLFSVNETTQTEPGVEHCTRIFRILLILYIVFWFILLICTEILFIKRVVALYGGSRLLSRILAGLFVCEFILGAVFCIGTFKDLGPGPIILVNISHNFFFFKAILSLPEIGFQAILVMFVINVIISDWRGISKGYFISIIVRDGIWSYVCNLCGLLVVFVQPAFLSGPLGLPNVLWSFASSSITSTRLILNLRAAAAKQSGMNNISSPGPVVLGVNTHLTFRQAIQSFLAPENDEFVASNHYSDLGHDSDSDNDD